MTRIRDKYMIVGNRDDKGFTLVELLVALVVSSIVLGAVAAFAFAVSSANKGSEDISCKQGQVRYATLRISELIRDCKLICGVVGDDLVIWRADKNRDGAINAGELVYIEKGSGSNYIRMLEFLTDAAVPLQLSSVRGASLKATLISTYVKRYTAAVPECSGVSFSFDLQPPLSRFVSISFNLQEGGAVRHYEINSALRCWAGNLLSSDGSAIVSDDD